MSFEHHLREAMALNRERKPIYAQMSRGRSKLISNMLIFAELVTIPIARNFEKRAAKWNRAGIDVVTGDFISMDMVKSPEQSIIIQQIRRKWIFPIILSIKIIISYLRYSFTGVQTFTDSLCNELDESIGNAMTKHLLESVWFIAGNAETYIALAKEEGIKSPKSVSRDLIFLHLTALPLANLIDLLAVPIQKKGVPIIINDIPLIHKKT